MFKVDQKFPEFSLETYNSIRDVVEIISGARFKNKFLVLFFYPADFTYVCPTELADLARRHEDFQKAGAEVVVVSTDTVFSHKAWLKTEELLKDFKFLMAADHNGKLSKELGIYDEESGLAQRAAFILDRRGVLRAADITADNIGRSAGEILRKVKALNFVFTHKGMACPASWDEGSATLTPSIKISGKVASALKGNKK
ncbi:MAG: redoxin domain-containing protein [Candidatus Liptonbacteria bacterium]|nr:redoxin domain-containing protein [Candidatus Liptonbacteria bacterium]